jgi:hypothetical protein
LKSHFGPERESRRGDGGLKWGEDRKHKNLKVVSGLKKNRYIAVKEDGFFTKVLQYFRSDSDKKPKTLACANKSYASFGNQSDAESSNPTII